MSKLEFEHIDKVLEGRHFSSGNGGLSFELIERIIVYKPCDLYPEGKTYRYYKMQFEVSHYGLQLSTMIDVPDITRLDEMIAMMQAASAHMKAVGVQSPAFSFQTYKAFEGGEPVKREELEDTMSEDSYSSDEDSDVESQDLSQFHKGEMRDLSAIQAKDTPKEFVDDLENFIDDRNKKD